MGVVEDNASTNPCSNHVSDERKFADSRIPASFLLENDGVDGEEHVDEKVYNRYVDGAEERDGVEENDPRSEQSDL